MTPTDQELEAMTYEQLRDYYATWMPAWRAEQMAASYHGFSIEDDQVVDDTATS